jgi:hypothetical protein
MRAPLVGLVLLALAALVVWLWLDPGSGWVDRGEGQLAPDFDVSLLDVRTALLVAGPPVGHPTRAEVTTAAVAGLAVRLAADGFQPAMRRGARPRPTIEVVDRLAHAQRVPPASLAADLADCSIYLALERFELLGWRPPDDADFGEVEFSLRGRVWVFLPADGGAREFFGDFAGRHQSRFQRAALEGAPEDPELAAAYLFGQRLLETWQRGLVWRSPREQD